MPAYPAAKLERFSNGHSIAIIPTGAALGAEIR